MDTSTPISPESPWPHSPGRGEARPLDAGRAWAPFPAWPLSAAQTLTLGVVLLVAMAGVFRVTGLDYGGFSEDETFKVRALRAYARGEWSANAEHPMVMKAAMFASSACAEAWNGVAARAGWPAVSPEAALRLPNALAGAAAVGVLFLLVRSFFGPVTALWASCLLALDVVATGVNRIGKEDSFLVLFLLLGAWLFEEARARHRRTGVAPLGWYAASGAGFGLMLASKYMPFYLGFWGVFLAAAASTERAGVVGGRRTSWGSRLRVLGTFAVGGLVAFVAANPAILLPSTWRYLVGYVNGQTITHHGAYFAGRVYMNMLDSTPGGLPWHFYLTYLAIKTPLPVLGAIALGLAELVRRRRERGAVFARVFLVLFLLPASLLAGKFARYLLPSIVMLDIVAALGVTRAFEFIARVSRPRLRALAAGALVAAVVGVPLEAQVRSNPYPSVHLNAIGRHLTTPGGMFPNDELYDMGIRESVRWIAGRAAPGASIASDAPGVVAEYLHRFGRPDIEARYLSMAGLARPGVETWMLAQNSHACFESLPMVEQVRHRQPPEFVVRVRGTSAVETYRLPW